MLSIEKTLNGIKFLRKIFLKLYEFEAKEILRKYGIAIPKGFLANSIQETSRAAAIISKPVAIKSQILLSGRGKKGGIILAHSILEAEKAAEKLLHTKIQEIPVNLILVEEMIPLIKELYFAFTVDRFNRSYVAISSPMGGMEIEELARKSPEKVLKTKITPKLGFTSFQAQKIAMKMGYKEKQKLKLAKLLQIFYRIAMNNDCILFEVNPLAETIEGKFVALDARIIIDDNALFRHPEFKKRKVEKIQKASLQEILAIESKIDYLKLKGNIGVIGNGAGLVMATLDMINHFTGKPANFLDLGGGANAERTKTALRIILLDSDVEVIFVNILGGITRCDEIARAIVEIKQSSQTKKPIIIRLIGTNEKEGKKILRNANLKSYDRMEEAIQKVVKLANKGVKSK